jgi:archaellum component FlaC
MTNTEELQQVLDKLNTLSTDFAEIKEDIKSIKKEINEIKTSQAVLVNDGKWIKILYGVFSSIIILLMGTLINVVGSR